MRQAAPPDEKGVNALCQQDIKSQYAESEISEGLYGQEQRL